MVKIGTRKMNPTRMHDGSSSPEVKKSRPQIRNVLKNQDGWQSNPTTQSSPTYRENYIHTMLIKGFKKDKETEEEREIFLSREREKSNLQTSQKHHLCPSLGPAPPPSSHTHDHPKTKQNPPARLIYLLLCVTCQAASPR